jgi:hypothetical protein
LADCSATSVSNDSKLRSEARAALSLAAESKLFIDYLSQDRATKPFAMAYVDYLQHQANHLLARLNRLKVAPGSKETLAECMKQTEALRSVLSNSSLISEDHALLVSIRGRVAEIEANLKTLAKPQ